MSDSLFDKMAKGDDIIIAEKIVEVFQADSGTGGLTEAIDDGTGLFPLNTITDQIPETLGVYDYDELPVLVTVVAATNDGEERRGPRVFAISAIVYDRRPDDLANTDSRVRQLSARVREVIRSQIPGGENWGLVAGDISGYHATGGTKTTLLRTIYIREGADPQFEEERSSVRGITTFEIEVPTRYDYT